MITKKTKQSIKGYLEGFIQGMIDEKKTASGFDHKRLRPARQESKKGDLKPFHESLLPDGLITITEFERSFSTKLGTTFEECAKLIAIDNHADAKRCHRITGEISLLAINRIEEIINEVDTCGMKSKYLDFVKDIINVAGHGKKIKRTSIADLYIKKKDGTQLFFEIKSPKPNKGQCLETTRRQLQIHGINYKQALKVKTYFASAYNPWGINKSTYKHTFAINYMDMEHEILVGKEFWDMVGGTGTYDEVLKIYQEVGREKGSDMLDQLVLKY